MDDSEAMDFPATFPILFKAMSMFMGMRYHFYLTRRSKENHPNNISAAVLTGVTGKALIGSWKGSLFQIFSSSFSSLQLYFL